MIKNIYEKCKLIFKKVITENLNGLEKREVCANIAKEIGRGGQSFVAKEFNIGRDTIRKGLHELESDVKCKDAFNMRGRKKCTDKLPNLTTDIKEIVKDYSQVDPKFQTDRIYIKLTVNQIRRRLIESKQYTDTELPTRQTLNTLLNNMGFNLKRVAKARPKKKIPETDEIFENLHEIYEETKDDDNIIRLSIDAKDKVKIGDFSRGGKNRVEVKALDHDFGDKYVTPFGFMDVKKGTVDISIATSKITADYIVDRLHEYWEEKNLANKDDMTLLLNLDNGPECSSSRTQFIKRMIQFSVKYDIKIILAYYPPYHSKYNPVERVWGVLERYWNSELLNSTEAVVGYAQTMTYKEKNPNVKLVEKVYETGIKLTKKVMDMYEKALDRKEGIGKWFVTIDPDKCKEVLDMELLT